MPVVSAVVTNEIERGNAVVIAGDSFTIDDAGARAQPGERINYQWEAAGEVVARTAIPPRADNAANFFRSSAFDMRTRSAPMSVAPYGHCLRMNAGKVSAPTRRCQRRKRQF